MSADGATLIADLRAEKEADSVETQARIKAFLGAAGVAIPAVLMAAAAGNVACREASLEIMRILGPLFPAGKGTQGTEGAEKIAKSPNLEIAK